MEIRPRITILHRRCPGLVNRWRQVVAVLCAVVFLAAGMIHSLSHCDGAGLGSGALLSSISVDQPTGKADCVFPCDHCPWCTGAIAASTSTFLMIVTQKNDPIILPVTQMYEHPPGLQTPPPKSAI